MTFNGDLENFILFERIARERCDHIRTLRTRNRDGLDFHDVPVWALLDMMQSAYDAGYGAGKEAPEQYLRDAAQAVIDNWDSGHRLAPAVRRLAAALEQRPLSPRSSDAD